MKLGIYLCICILIILIIIFISVRYYLVYNYTTLITIYDGNFLKIDCPYYNIDYLYAIYSLKRGKKINMILSINKIIENIQKNKFNRFIATDYNLPANGKLIIRYRCKYEKNTFFPKKNNIEYSPDIPIFPVTGRNAEGTVTGMGNSQSYILQDSTATSPETASKPNILTGTGQYDIVQRLQVNPFNQERPFNSHNSSSLKNLLANTHSCEADANNHESKLTGDSPMSYVTNGFAKKYPTNSVTSKLAIIDPEYYPNGLYNEAQGLNNLLAGLNKDITIADDSTS